MKLKHLESLLQQVEPFTDPKIQLEQYQTSSHIAASILMSEVDAFEGKSVMDLGCGSGILTAGPLFLGADHVIGVDIDPDALRICRRNLIRCFHDPDDGDDDDDPTGGERRGEGGATRTCAARYDLMQGDVSRLGEVVRSECRLVDCVIMNPPFGTRNPGIDISFLQAALSLTPTAVYSLHKSSTREGIRRRCSRLRVDMEILAELRFDLPATYKFHHKKSSDVEVDFVRFTAQ